MSRLRPVLPLALPLALGLALMGCGSLKSPEVDEFDMSRSSIGADSNAESKKALPPADYRAGAGKAEEGQVAQPVGAANRQSAAPDADPVDEAERGDTLTADFLSDAPAGRSYQSGVEGAAGVTSGTTATAAPPRPMNMIPAEPSEEGRVRRNGLRGKDNVADKAKEALDYKAGRTLAPSPAVATTKRPAPPPIASTVPVVPESQTEVYTDYGINGFTLTERDRLSTFAADVDTASYTITRRKLREGYLPPAAAVRVEEFVNYFPYEYAQPGPGHPFAVDVEAAPSPFNPQNHIVRIGVQGKKVHFDTRRPVNLTFLVDVSGSMQSRDKIGLLKDSLRMLTKELEDGDTVALVTYAGATKVVLSPTPISQRDRILGALDGLTAGGSTAMGAGINLAYQQAELGYRAGAVNRVIVASDGDANVGATSHTQLADFIAAKAKKGITLTTLGFGNGNYKDTMMERLANDGDGNYYYIDSLQESRRLFVDQLSSTLEVIAKDVKLQVEFNPDTVLAYRLIGYENRDIADRDFRNDAVDAGEIGAGHQVTALYEVALKDDVSAGLGTVRVRNKAPGPDSPAVERRYEVPSSIIQGRFVSASPQFRLQTAAAGFAEILRGSPHMNEISLRMVGDIARNAKRVEYSEDSELVELIDRAARLRGEGAVSQR